MIFNVRIKQKRKGFKCASVGGKRYCTTCMCPRQDLGPRFLGVYVLKQKKENINNYKLSEVTEMGL